MDTMARALLAAAAMLEDGSLEAARTARYAAWDAGHGQDILDGTVSLAALRDRARELGEPVRRSGRQEELENLVARFVERAR